MLVEFGNVDPQHAPDRGDGNVIEKLPGPAVTRLSIPDTEEYKCEPGADVRDLALHLAQNTGLVTHLPDHGAFVCAVRDWANHSSVPPAWVSSDNKELERLLSEFYECEVGAPKNVEATHYTRFGPPGVGPVTAKGA
jgi:hypothetical protein